jgi:hypothetical protein
MGLSGGSLPGTCNFVVSGGCLVRSVYLVDSVAYCQDESSGVMEEDKGYFSRDSFESPSSALFVCCN